MKVHFQDGSQSEVTRLPAAYRMKPGANVLAWMKRKGWIDRRTVGATS